MMNATLDVYLDFLRIPFSYYQAVANETEAAMQRSRPFAQHETQQAIKAVANACAANTQVVTITSQQPFKVSPNNLFKVTFASVGIISDVGMEAFRQTLIGLLPDALREDVQKMEIAPGIVIGLVVDHIEALLDALPDE